MSKFNLRRRLRHAWQAVVSRTTGYVKSFGKQTDEVLAEEPIDFSAPSIPYYENLANRLNFVRVVLYMVLLVFVVVTVASNHKLITYENLYYLAKDIGAATLTAQSQVDHLSYPVSSASSDFVLYRGGLAVAGSEEITILSGSGRQTLSVNSEYAEPCARASDKYLITFGRGETGFAVYNSFVRVYAERTDFPIYEATVADNGYFAVVTRSRDYTSEVIVYDSDMEKLANYHLNGYVMSLDINAEGTNLGVVSAEAVGGVWETKITIIRLGNRITYETATLGGELGTLCGFTAEDRLAVVTSDRLMVLKPDATVTGEVLLEDCRASMCAIDRGRVAILTESDADLTGYGLTVYDKNGREVYTAERDIPALAGHVTELSWGDTTLYIRTDDRLWRVSGNGNSITSAPITRDVLAILPQNSDEVLVCHPAYAERFGTDDFE